MKTKHFLKELNDLRTLNSSNDLSDWGKDRLKEYEFILTELIELKKLRVADVVGRSEQFNCLGGNYAKGINPCEEWCGEDMCQKPSN